MTSPAAIQTARPAAADRPAFSHRLREAAGEHWHAATGHPFTVAIGDDAIDAARYAVYVIEDRHFIDAFTSVIGYTLAKAPQLATRRRLAEFIAGALNEDNDYFGRSFAALGVDPATALAAPPRAGTGEIAEAMLSGARDGTYEDGLIAILAAEWTYLTWGLREAAKPRPARAYLAEWIDLHAVPPFQDFVGWLRSEVDRAGAGLADAEQVRLADRFRDLCRMEAGFFEQAWTAG